MTENLDTVLARLLTRWQPSSLLLVAPADDPVARAAAAAAGCAPTWFTNPERPEALNELGRFDAGLVANTLQGLDRRQGERLLARLRDLHTGCFAVVTASPGRHGTGRPGDVPAWNRREMLSLGLHWECRCESEGGRHDVYVYDVRRYKRTPDWLNARDWANPELWDQYRW